METLSLKGPQRGQVMKVSKWEKEILVECMVIDPTVYHISDHAAGEDQLEKILAYLDTGEADDTTREMVDEWGWRPIYLDEDQARIQHRKMFEE